MVEMISSLVVVGRHGASKQAVSRLVAQGDTCRRVTDLRDFEQPQQIGHLQMINCRNHPFHHHCTRIRTIREKESNEIKSISIARNNPGPQTPSSKANRDDARRLQVRPDCM